MDERRRAAENESRFRKVNEGIDAGRGLLSADEPLPFVCECGQLGCAEVISVPIGEYEAVRTSGRRFIVLPAHVNPDIERVVAEGDQHVVVEKLGEAARLAEARDPRAGDASDAGN